MNFQPTGNKSQTEFSMLNSSPAFENCQITQGLEGLGQSLLGLSFQIESYLPSFGLPPGEQDSKWRKPRFLGNFFVHDCDFRKESTKYDVKSSSLYINFSSQERQTDLWATPLKNMAISLQGTVCKHMLPSESISLALSHLASNKHMSDGGEHLCPQGKPVLWGQGHSHARVCVPGTLTCPSQEALHKCLPRVPHEWVMV